MLTRNTQFISLEVAFIVKHDWEEILELTESTILFIIHNLQERQKYKSELDVARRLYPSAGGFRLGLDAKGRLIRITFKEAKRILRETIGRQTDDQEDFSYVNVFFLCVSQEFCLSLFIFLPRTARAHHER